MKTCKKTVNYFILIIIIVFSVQVSAKKITAFNNTNLILSQQMCISEGKRGNYEIALEWGRSGIFTLGEKLTQEDYSSVTLVLLQCIISSKEAINRRGEIGIINFELVGNLSNPSKPERKLSYYLENATPQKLVEIAEYYLQAKDLNFAEIALTAALEKSKSGIGKFDPIFMDSIRTYLAEVEFHLGAAKTAEERSLTDINYRRNRELGSNVQLSQAILGKSLILQEEWERGHVVLGELFTALKSHNGKQVKHAWYDRPANTSGQYSTQLELLVRSTYREFINDKKLNKAAIPLGFEVAQFASIGAVSDAYEDLSMRLALRKSGLYGVLKQFQTTRKNYDSGMDEFEQNLLNLIENRSQISRQHVEPLSKLSADRLKIHQLSMDLNNSKSHDLKQSNFKLFSIKEVQEKLSTNETLVFYFEAPSFHNIPESTFIWLINNSNVSWKKVAYGAKKLKSMVAKLRCGLDIDAATTLECKDLTGQKYGDTDRKANLLPVFDIKLSAQLYDILFPVNTNNSKLRKKLIIAPSPSLIALPFNALISSKKELPDTSRYFEDLNIPWLVMDHSARILPSLTGFLNKKNKQSKKTNNHRLLSFGNPLLLGEPLKNSSHAKWQAETKKSQQCKHQPKTPYEHIISQTNINTDESFIDYRQLLKLQPLIHARDEICNFAIELAPVESKLFLGEGARESVLKALSKGNDAMKASVIHFATHALLSSEIEGIEEPGIVLTPPDVGNMLDDGYLSASEIANLNLDADLIILSACNTAGGGKRSNATLAGLARAFFLAGGHSLIVSHWAAASSPAAITIGQMGHHVKDYGLSPEALQKATHLLAVNHRFHPYAWAQFFFVG